MPPVSKIAQLPEEIRAYLHKLLVQRGFGDIVAVTAEINEMCKQGGVALTLGKSAVGAESLRIRRAAESIRATTDAARVIAEQSRDDADLRGEAVMAMIQEGMIDTLLMAREAEASDDPMERLDLMGKAALAAARISTARVRQGRRRDEVEDRAKASADQVSKLARQGGLSEATVAEIRASILGIVPRASAPAGA